MSRPPRAARAGKRHDSPSKPDEEKWRPKASIRTLKIRAELLRRTRQFLLDRGLWEVETPILSRDVCVDTHLDPFVTSLELDRADPRRRNREPDALYLQTSPEFGMKRLLAAGAGSIFQITRAFRRGESGARHNPEFTIVEWYRVGETYHQLMDEVDALARVLLATAPAERVTYREAFARHADCDPFDAAYGELQGLAHEHGLSEPQVDRDNLLNFLFASLVEPRLGVDRPVFLFDFPASQAALARVRLDKAGGPVVAERFELFIGGLEVCNGYQELTDADEQRRRAGRQNELRREAGKRSLPADSLLLSAMRRGLPECAGVAVGFDRLVMLATGLETLADVVAFPLDRA